MDLSLTYTKLLNFPEDFLKTSVKYCELTDVISKRECDKYDLKEIKSYVDDKLQEFRDTKYLYMYPNEKYNIPITPNYQLREVMTPRSLSSPQEKKINPTINRQIWATKVYYCFMDNLSTKLTRQESVYFIDSYFRKVSEENISEKLSMCKATLQKVKKSCLIKVWTEMKALEDYYEEIW